MGLFKKKNKGLEKIYDLKAGLNDEDAALLAAALEGMAKKYGFQASLASILKNVRAAVLNRDSLPESLFEFCRLAVDEAAAGYLEVHGVGAGGQKELQEKLKSVPLTGA